MSKIAFCKRGGQDGILVPERELHTFNTLLGSKFGDEFIPLPEMKFEDQKELVKTCEHPDYPQYWETDKGSHGWCCTRCGSVTQWG